MQHVMYVTRIISGLRAASDIIAYSNDLVYMHSVRPPRACLLALGSGNLFTLREQDEKGCERSWVEGKKLAHMSHHDYLLCIFLQDYNTGVPAGVYSGAGQDKYINVAAYTLS